MTTPQLIQKLAQAGYTVPEGDVLSWLLTEVLPRVRFKQHDITTDGYSLSLGWEPNIAKWKAGYKRDADNYWWIDKAVADTPLSAALRLACALLDAGVLPRKGNV